MYLFHSYSVTTSEGICKHVIVIESVNNKKMVQTALNMYFRKAGFY